MRSAPRSLDSNHLGEREAAAVKGLVELDLTGAIENIERHGTPARTFFFEHGIEPEMTRGIAQHFDLCAAMDPTDEHFELTRTMRVWSFLGLEFLRMFPGGITWRGLPTGMTSVPPAVGPITSANREAIVPYVRTIIEKCVPGGGFAFGVGNWVADSIPFENYLTLVEVSRAVR